MKQVRKKADINKVKNSTREKNKEREKDTSETKEHFKENISVECLLCLCLIQVKPKNISKGLIYT